MSLFRGKSERTAERAAGAAALHRYEALQAALLRDIKEWLERLASTQEECGAATLDDSVIRLAGRRAQSGYGGAELVSSPLSEWIHSELYVCPHERVNSQDVQR